MDVNYIEDFPIMDLYIVHWHAASHTWCRLALACCITHMVIILTASCSQSIVKWQSGRGCPKLECLPVGRHSVSQARKKERERERGGTGEGQGQGERERGEARQRQRGLAL